MPIQTAKTHSGSGPLNLTWPPLPGLVIVIIVGSVSWLLGQYVPRLGAVTIAILLGVLVGNVIPDMTRYGAGVKFAEKRLLPFSIALLGVELQLATLVALGPIT